VIRVVYAALLAGVVVVFWIWRAAGNFDLRFGLTVLIGLFLAPHLNYQDALLAILPAVLAYDFAQRHQRLIPVFQVLILMLTFLPPTLILIGYFRIPQWIWPLPLIVCLGAICATFLMQARERRGDHSAHL
jgi:4-hydroxybenzoate polyprenyltransferase